MDKPLLKTYSGTYANRFYITTLCTYKEGAGLHRLTFCARDIIKIAEITIQGLGMNESA